MVKKNIIKLDTDFTKNVSISNSFDAINTTTGALKCAGNVKISKNVTVGNNINISDRAIINNLSTTHIGGLPITNSSNLVSLAITNNKLQINTLPNIETGIIIYANLPSMLTGMATKEIGKQAITSDTGSFWLKVGTTVNPYYHLVGSANLTLAAQTFSSAKYEITASTTKPTTYTKTITTSATTKIMLLDANKKYVHFEIKVTDELPPIIQAPFGTVTNITTSTPTFSSSGTIHTWTNYIEYTGTIPLTVASSYVIRSTDQGLNSSPPNANLYKFINLSLDSLTPGTKITWGPGNVGTYLVDQGTGWDFTSGGTYYNTGPWYMFKEGNKYRLFGMATGWLGLETTHKSGNQLLNNANFTTDVSVGVVRPQLGYDQYLTCLKGYGGNGDTGEGEANAATFVALKEPNHNYLNLYPMVNPNGPTNFTNVYLTKNSAAGYNGLTRAANYASLVSWDCIPNQNRQVMILRSPNYADRFLLFCNWNRDTCVGWNWKTIESNTSTDQTPKIIWNKSDEPSADIGLPNTSRRIGYWDFHYNPGMHWYGDFHFKVYGVA